MARPRKHWRGKAIAWSVCAVVGVALMALAVVARLSHEPMYGSAIPGPVVGFGHGMNVSIKLSDGRSCEVHCDGELEERRILGSIVPRYRWEFVKNDDWRLIERTPDGFILHEIYTNFGEVLDLLDQDGATIAGVPDFFDWRAVPLNLIPGAGSASLPHVLYEGTPGVTNDLARIAVERARQTYERDPQAWQRVRSFQQGGSDAIVVYTELDYPSVWVFLGQFVTVHPWVFGIGFVLFGGGMFGFVKYGVVRGRRRKQGRCLRCGYEMREVVEAMRERGEEKIVCSECGSEVEG